MDLPFFYPLALMPGVEESPREVPAKFRKPWWLYPNLLSLDAPLVAVAWLHVFAKTWRLYLPWPAYVTLGLGVWVIYVLDRLLDASMAEGSSKHLKARHKFHRLHSRPFRYLVGLALVSAIIMVTTQMPMSIYSNLVIGGVLVAGFFGISMISSQEPNESPILKNVLAGLGFAFGTAMTAHIYRNELGLMELVTSREFLSFTVLCILNISAIDLWEHASRSRNAEISAFDELTLTLPLTLLGIASLTFALLDISSRPFFYAILTATALLFILNRHRQRFSMDAIRVLADVALLAPLLVFFAPSGA